MGVLKIIGKMLLVPVWIVVAIIWLIVKGMVAIYSFTRGFVAFVLGMLIVGTIICYQDWKLVLFLLCISGITFMVLFTGVFIEVQLDILRASVMKTILN